MMRWLGYFSIIKLLKQLFLFIWLEGQFLKVNKTRNIVRLCWPTQTEGIDIKSLVEKLHHYILPVASYLFIKLVLFDEA